MVASSIGLQTPVLRNFKFLVWLVWIPKCLVLDSKFNNSMAILNQMKLDQRDTRVFSTHFVYLGFRLNQYACLLPVCKDF